jgi:hypothetical protein
MFASNTTTLKNNAAPVPVPFKWNNSIFIPVIDFSLTKNQIKDIMEKNFGKVSRIDFASFNSNNGSGRRVFIHFTQWYNTDYAKNVRKSIETNGFYDMSIPLCNNSKYTTRLLINKNPVPETEQTIQQVASNVDFMAEKIRIQEEEILALKQLCENLFYNMKTMEVKMNTLLQNENSGVKDDIMGEMNISEL